MIKWCIYLRHLSSSAYDTLRNSGCLRLPSDRTLRDYTHCISSKVGFTDAVDEQLVREAEIGKVAEWQKYVVLIFDEMHVREDLVYHKATGEMVGFVDLGDINNHLAQLERSCQAPAASFSQLELGTKMLCFMVRGLFIRLQFPYGAFPCSVISGSTLFPLVWEAVRRLEGLGFKVLALVADGASPNRKFFKLNSEPEKGSNTPVYKVPNPYSEEQRDIFFISDVPHLMKTTRNCWSNASRHL